MALMVDGALLTETRERVLAWFAEAGRDLPWRATRDPYRVLVAEVLAQQTQAARAAAAWPRFLERFPDVHALAAAAPAEVLRAWQGLGYNRRALALHRTARAVEERGGWPDTVEELAALPGIGPYTARAVACFALDHRVAPVDTNVARVLARSLAGADPADLTPAARQRLADRAMPEGQPWVWSSALMDVGALHCRPRPRCQGCPLAPSCRWRTRSALLATVTKRLGAPPLILPEAGPSAASPSTMAAPDLLTQSTSFFLGASSGGVATLSRNLKRSAAWTNAAGGRISPVAGSRSRTSTSSPRRCSSVVCSGTTIWA